ncbi:hypothetical protein EJP77_18905 [Paenibacillus zeisoli]|uniref:Uncharacterized protein n=1 Tax=Paenibacillus zeisoli TaxID=2496267 RepID=A0A3S1D6I2_9BACL|nr:hypothetical protein [Paenibacillus zeisoli]RUT27907.1 hypothetical protein EJP77_18905 [Paenibacillus zeisoli]
MQRGLIKLFRTSVCMVLVFGGIQSLSGSYVEAASEIQIAQTTKEAESELTLFVRNILGSLSEQEPFEDWKQAEFTAEPLGPGTHAWFITIRPGASQSEEGYLIIGAKPGGGYALIEYGRGSGPLFSAKSLEHAIALIRDLGEERDLLIQKLYAGPALAEWKISAKGSTEESRYFDAVSGELLPETDMSWTKQVDYTASPDPSLIQSYSRGMTPMKTVVTAQAFNTYENISWMTQKPLKMNEASIIKQLQLKKKLVFASRGSGRTYSLSLPVNGFQRWTHSETDSLYVLSKSGGSIRWISLASLEKMGGFYTVNGS